MARLPQPGGDNGNWGTILNDYLSQTHNADGTIKDNVIQESSLASSVQSKLNSSSSPDWSSITNKPAVIAAGANQVAARAAISVGPTKTIFVDNYNSDPTGVAASDSAVAAAIAALGNNKGIIEFGIGTYKLNNSQVLAHAGQYFRGQGVDVTTIDFRGTGPALRCWDSTVATDGNSAPGRGGGVLGGLTITGVNNTNNNAIGLRIGDLIEATVESTRIIGFSRSGGVGFSLYNRYSWTEYSSFTVLSDYNETCIVIEADSLHPHPYGPTSFSYNNFDFGFNAEANQTGVHVRGGSVLIGVNWKCKFNCNPGPTNTGVAFKIGTDWNHVLANGEDFHNFEYNHIEAEMDFSGETTNPGAVGHIDFMFGPFSGWRGHGACILNEFSASFQAGNTKPWDYKFVFAGRHDSASFGHYAKFEMPFVTIGDSGRFSAHGDDGRYLIFQEGDGPAQTYPLIQPAFARNELTWNPTTQTNIQPDKSMGLVLQSRFSTTETKKSLITIDGVNVVEALDGLGAHISYDGHYTAWTYVPLATLPPDSDTNAASLKLSGRMGGFETRKIGLFDMILANRSAAFDGNTVYAAINTKGDVWSTDDLWTVFDIVAYKQSDLSTKFYLKLNGFYVYDFLANAHKGTIDWNLENLTDQIYGGAPATVPTGTQIWTLSGEPQFNKTTPNIVEQAQSFTGQVKLGNGGVIVDDTIPANALHFYSGATSFDGGPSQEIYFGSHKLHDVAAPTDWNDAATLGWVTDKVNASVPWGPTANGTAGQFAYDGTHFYVCVATNSWMRTTLSSW